MHLIELFAAFEKKAIQASAAVQQQLGCCVSFHPGRNPQSPDEIIRVFTEAGGKTDNVIMGHLESGFASVLVALPPSLASLWKNFIGTIQIHSDLVEFAKHGSYCQFDLFGIENSYYQLMETIDYPSDAQRMDMVVALVNAGFEDKVLLAHDIHTKHRLVQKWNVPN